MEIEFVEAAPPSLDVVKLNITDTEIAKLKADFLPLTIRGIEDKIGLKKVYDSRQIVKKTRTGIVKYADELKEKAISWQRKVNAEKDRIVEDLESIEAHLQGEEDKMAAEKEAIEQARLQAEADRVQKRIDALAAYGYAIDYTTVKTIDDASFELVLSNAKDAHEKELAEKAEAARLAQEEAERLKKEREELEELRRKQAEAQAIIDRENDRIRKEQEEKEAAILAEQKRIEDEKKAIEAKRLQDIEDKRRADELEKAKAQAAEDARLKTIADAKAAEEKKAEQARIAAAKEAKRLALAPDKEKLLLLAGAVSLIAFPELKSVEAKAVLAEVKTLLAKVDSFIKSKAETL